MTIENPFFKMPKWLSGALVGYFLVYKLVIPVIRFSFASNFDPSLLPFFFLDLIYAILLFLPVLLPFKNTGIFHPLVFPLLFGLAKATVSTTGTNFIPDFSTSYRLEGTSAFELGAEAIYIANLKKNLFAVLGLALYYAGYFTTKKVININKLKIHVANLSLRNYAPGLTFLALLLLLFFLQSMGGLTAYMSSWGVSRKSAMEGLGPILAVMRLIYVFPLIWFITQNSNKLLRNPLFLAVMLTSILAGFITTGSRSSVLVGLAPFIIVWIIKYQRIPVVLLSVAAASFFVLFGVLGTIRSSTFEGQVDWSAATDFNVAESASAAAAEAKEWSGLGADIAIFHAVPEKNEYLFGKSYAAALLFFIPRNLWNEKPHGAGFYTGREVFGRGQAGVPPGQDAEIYYNFGWLGLIFMYLLSGRITRLVVNTILKQGLNDAFVLVLFISFLISFRLTGIGLVQYFQQLLFMLIIFAVFSKETAIAIPGRGKLNLHKPVQL